MQSLFTLYDLKSTEKLMSKTSLIFIVCVCIRELWSMASSCVCIVSSSRRLCRSYRGHTHAVTLWTDRSIKSPSKHVIRCSSATLNSFQVHFHSDVTIRVFQASGTISVQFINWFIIFALMEWRDQPIGSTKRHFLTLCAFSPFILSFVFMQILNLIMLNKPTMHVVM